MSSLRGAPLFLRPSVVRKLVNDLGAISKHVAQVPIEPVRLVDQPRPSALRDSEAGEEITRFETAHHAPDNDIESVAAYDLNADRAGSAAHAPEGTSGEADDGTIISPANACEQPTELPDPVKAAPCSGDSEPGSPREPESAPVQPASTCNGAQLGRPGAPPASEQPSLRNLARRKVETSAGSATVDRLEVIRAAAAKVAKRSPAGTQIDWRRVASAHAVASARASTIRKSKGVPSRIAPSREECPLCGIPGWKGCAHFLPCEEPPQGEPCAADPKPRSQMKFTGKRQGIGASRL